MIDCLRLFFVVKPDFMSAPHAIAQHYYNLGQHALAYLYASQFATMKLPWIMDPVKRTSLYHGVFFLLSYVFACDTEYCFSHIILFYPCTLFCFSLIRIIVQVNPGYVI